MDEKLIGDSAVPGFGTGLRSGSSCKTGHVSHNIPTKRNNTINILNCTCKGPLSSRQVREPKLSKNCTTDGTFSQGAQPSKPEKSIVNPSEIRWASQIWEPTPRPVLITGAYPGVKVYGTAPVDTVVGETAAAERLDLLGLERAARERKGLVCVFLLTHLFVSAKVRASLRHIVGSLSGISWADPLAIEFTLASR